MPVPSANDLPDLGHLWPARNTVLRTRMVDASGSGRGAAARDFRHGVENFTAGRW
jgi:hypothetical protein